MSKNKRQMSEVKYKSITDMFSTAVKTTLEKTNKREEKKSNPRGVKRKADEVFEEKVEDNSHKKKIIGKSNIKEPIKTENRTSSAKKKKIIDDDEDEDFDIGEMNLSEDEDKDYEMEGKGKKAGVNKKNLTKSGDSKKNRKSTKEDIIDDEEMEIINQQFKEIEEEEKTHNVKARATRNMTPEKKNETTSTNNINNNNNIVKKTAAKGKSKKAEDDFLELEVTNKKNKRKAAEEDDFLELEGTNKKNKRKAVIALQDVVGPLNGYTFVITGVFQTLDRDCLTNLLKGYGAKVTSKVTGKTNYLLTGYKLEDERFVSSSAKYKEALTKGVKMMNEQELTEFLKDKLKDNDFDLKKAFDSENNKVDVKLGKTISSANIKMDVDDEKIPNNIININKSELWTTKHSPRELSEVIGNQKVINQFILWLDDWEDVVMLGNKKELKDTFRGKGKIENLNARACLISGDPGIGKTTIVRLLAKLKGYKAFELNASDQRNKSIISSKLGYLLDNTTLYDKEIQSKNVIIMDEVDGMGGNEDRGGVAALIDVIKRTKTPIICIANDRNHQKLRSLVNHCYDLKFSKPDKRLIVSRLAEICHKENLQVELNALEYLCESVGNDIRQCLNFLDFWSRKFKDLTYMDMSNKYQKFSKDSLLMMSNFDASAKLLNKAAVNKLNFREKLNLYFIDYDLIPLLIHENYLSCYNDKNKDLKSLVKSTEHISVGDLIEKKIRSQQEWNLLQNKGIHSCLAVGQFSGNFIPFPKFPEMMGKFQKMKKVKREVRELKYCFPNAPARSIREEVAPLVLSKISNTLADFGSEGVENVLNFMKEYKISIEKFKDNIFDLNPSEKIANKYDKLAAPIKASLTRKYNELFKTSVVRKKKRELGDGSSKVKYDEEGNVLEELDDDEEAKEEEDNVTVKTKETTKAKTKTKSTKKK